MRKLILTTASILALGIGGSGVGLAAGMTHNAPNAGANMPAASEPSNLSQHAVNPSKDEVRQAQQQLRDQGLYNGAIDGVIGPGTKQALQQFQQKNGLNVTATLDQQTMDRLLGTGAGVGQGSSMPPQHQGNAPVANPQQPSTSNLGDHGAPQR